MNLIRFLRWGVLAFVITGAASVAQQGASSGGHTDFVALLFGHDPADFLARIAALVLYGASVLSAGLHRAWPNPDPEKHRAVCLIIGIVDAMSVNGRGTRSGASVDVQTKLDDKRSIAVTTS